MSVSSIFCRRMNFLTDLNQEKNLPKEKQKFKNQLKKPTTTDKYVIYKTLFNLNES